MIGSAYLTDGGHALYGYISQLTGGEPDQGVSAFLSHQLSHNASGTGQLRALAGVHLNVVDKGTNRNVQHGQSIAGLDVSAGAGHYGVTNRQAGGSDDVALLAVLVLDQRDVSGTVGIVLQGENGGGDTGLVSLEVDDAVLSAVSAASVADGDLTGVVAAGVLLQAYEQASLGSNLGKPGVISHSHLTTAGAGGLELFDSHCGFTLLILVGGIMSQSHTGCVLVHAASYSIVSKNSMPLDPSARVTMAFFQSDL